MAFTSWTAIETAIKDDIANNLPVTMRYFQKGPHQITYATMEQALSALEMVRRMKIVDGEVAAIDTTPGRTYGVL